MLPPPANAGLEALPAQIGPYRIDTLLGRGGMGVVYRAAHIATGVAVALKTVEAPAPTAIAAIRREVRALGRLSHPGIVRILDEGVADGLPWMAMELLTGVTLRGHLAGVFPPPALGASSTLAATVGAPVLSATAPLGDGIAAPTPPSSTCAASIDASAPLLLLIARLAEPLAHLHAAGLVHRDLKPDNVMVRPDGAPVLVDLGIFAPFAGADGREELAVDAAVMGSLAYMAPEQIRGELVDARADLYALGCILHEALTGAPPFVRGSAEAVIHAHLHDAPPDVRGAPEGLARLLRRMLEKRPEDRLGHAEEVAAALAALGVPGVEPPVVPAIPAYLYRPALSGRAQLLDEIAPAVDQLRETRQGGTWLLGGEGGVGKTRLAMEIARRATRAGVAVCVGQALPDGPPLHLLRPLLTAVADRCHDDADAARLLGARGKVLATYAPAIAELPFVRAQPEPPPLPPEAARARVLAAIEETARALAGEAPLLLVLDDLHWADDISLAFLAAHAPRDHRGEGLLVLGTYRMEERSAELAELARHAHDILVGRLDRRGVAALVSGMLALEQPPPSLADFVYESTDGNPFFAAEYLRAAIGAGLLEQAPDRGLVLRRGPLSVPLPRTLAALLERRLGALDEAGRALVSWAAVLGREVDEALLEQLAGLGEVGTLEAVEALRVGQILEARAAGRLSFVHDSLREIAHARIAPEARRAMHARAAAALATRAETDEGLLAALGHHHAEAGDHAEASRCFARAADRARAAYANGEAIRLYRAALREAGEAAPVALAEALGDVLGLVGRQDEARAAYAEAAAQSLADAVARARLQRKLGMAWEVHHARAEATLGEAGSEAPAGWWDEWVEVQIHRISAHYWAADVEAMRAAVARVRPVIEAGATAAQRARFFRALTQLGLRMERYLPSLDTVHHARACLSACEEEAGSPDLAATRFAFATVLLWHGALDEAEDRLLAVLGEAERTGDVTLQARSLTYLTQVWRRRRVPEVRSFARRSLAVAEEAQMTDYAGAALANLAWVALEEGALAEARKLGEEALTRLRSPGLVYPFAWMALLPLLAAANATGDPEAAAAHGAALLDPLQQRLPEALTEALEQARREGGAKRAVGTVIERARALGYL